jgi:hypothetical protein
MNQAELLEALAPVREYFSGKDVNENTVLAAYLRSNGLPAYGEPWERAKTALAQGLSFERAALAAADSSAPMSAAREGESRGSGGPTPHQGSVLSWFPKKFSPGDLDGVGAKRLLGTPDMPPTSVLVRETAQNSWDAKGSSNSIRFSLNLRELSPSTVEVLRKRVFTADAPKTGIRELLKSETIWALEVSDRGTVGLGGPLRNDLSVNAGEDTNFIDFVLNIGAPRDVHLGGGTYGFGKTIAYVVSGVGTILISSRCEGLHGLEQRFIGSTIADGFDMNGYRYTGRHWWGNAIANESRVEPVTGDLAEELTELIFSTNFDSNGTGTSLLILDPQLQGESPAERAEALVQAVVENLWPKLVVNDELRCRMDISVELNGELLPLPDIENHATLSGHTECLRAVRAVQAGHELESLNLRYPVIVEKVQYGSQKKLLGHIALTRYPVPIGTETPSRSVTLMRSHAELVVKELPRQPLDVEGFQWAGVFKPTTDVDDSFAAAEPPAHDDWVPAAVKDRTHRTFVNVALTKIRSIADSFIGPPESQHKSDDQIQSAAVAGDALAGLLGGVMGSAPGRKKPSTTTGKHAVRPKVVVLNAQTSEGSLPGWARSSIEVQLTDTDAESLPVEAIVRVGVEGGVERGSENDRDAIRILGWVTPADGEFESSPVSFEPNQLRYFVFEARSDLLIDIDVKVVEYR